MASTGARRGKGRPPTARHQLPPAPTCAALVARRERAPRSPRDRCPRAARYPRSGRSGTGAEGRGAARRRGRPRARSAVPVRPGRGRRRSALRWAGGGAALPPGAGGTAAPGLLGKGTLLRSSPFPAVPRLCAPCPPGPSRPSSGIFGRGCTPLCPLSGGDLQRGSGPAAGIGSRCVALPLSLGRILSSTARNYFDIPLSDCAASKFFQKSKFPVRIAIRREGKDFIRTP